MSAMTTLSFKCFFNDSQYSLLTGHWSKTDLLRSAGYLGILLEASETKIQSLCGGLCASPFHINMKFVSVLEGSCNVEGKKNNHACSFLSCFLKTSRNETILANSNVDFKQERSSDTGTEPLGDENSVLKWNLSNYDDWAYTILLPTRVKNCLGGTGGFCYSRFLIRKHRNHAADSDELNYLLSRNWTELLSIKEKGFLPVPLNPQFCT